MTTPAPDAQSITAVLRAAEASLERYSVPTPKLDAEILLALALRTNRTALYARMDQRVDDNTIARFQELMARRAQREPIAYIRGNQEFWSLSFEVTPDVLIPRPETEGVVDAAHEILTKMRHARVCEMGSGSGCIAIALAHEVTDLRVVSLDISPKAIAVAQRNAAVHRVGGRVQFIESDLFSALKEHDRFDIIVSNPPYVADRESLPPELTFEPKLALTSGMEGLTLIRRLVAEAPKYLKDEGWLVMEFGQGQDRIVKVCAAEAGFTGVETRLDLAGIPRILVAHWKKDQGA